MFTVVQPVKRAHPSSKKGAPIFNTRIPVRTNVLKNENSYEIHMALPGFTREELTIDIQDNQLIIQGKVGENHPVQALRMEFSKADFTRSFELNKDIDIDNIEAEMEAGILKMVLPLFPEKAARKIDIQ